MAVSKIVSGNGYGSVTINSTGCDRLVIVAVGGGLATFTDNKNASGWQALTAQNDIGATRTQMWYHESPTVGSGHTFTHAQSYGALAVIGFTGWAASSAFDAENGNALAVGGLTINTGSVTPSENDCVLVAGIGTGGDPSGSAPSGFIVAEYLVGVGGTNYGVAIAFKIQTTAGAENPQFSHTPSAVCGAVIAAFKSDGIGGGGGLAMPPRRAFPMSILNH